MITKQQALEFIYELSKTYTVIIDLPVGTFKVTHKDDTFHGCSYGQDLETMIRNFIDVYIRIKKIVKVNFPIPVDVDMLEVGQTYKVHIQEDWDHRFFTAKFLGFDEEDNYVVKFENNKPCTKFDFREIYKVNEHANM